MQLAGADHLDTGALGLTNNAEPNSGASYAMHHRAVNILLAKSSAWQYAYCLNYNVTAPEGHASPVTRADCTRCDWVSG